MPKQESPASRVAKHGEKTIEITVRLWTNDIAELGRVVPKHARTSGVVKVEANKLHGISDSKPVPFHSLLDLNSVIERLLIFHEITLHPSRRMRKYMPQ